MMVYRVFLFLLAVVGFAAVTGAQSVFDMPRLFPRHKQVLGQFLRATQQGDLLGAETAARAAVKIFPRDANWHYNVACVCARDNRPDEALDWLDKAIVRGFSDMRALEQDDDLTSIRGTERFRELVAKARELAKNPPKNATLSAAIARDVPPGEEALVTAEDTQWDWDPLNGGFMTTLLRLHAPKTIDPATYAGPHADLVRPWLHGNPAAYAGVLYVNRDEDLAAVRFEAFPGLTPVIYDEEAVKAGAHKGVANGLFSTGLSTLATIGNSSMALGTPPFWRSIPRLISTEATTAAVTLRLALANQLYVYDATPDYNKAFLGDVLIANNPAIILSTDRAEKPDAKTAQRDLTELLLAAFAAFTPETKAEMLRRGLLVPTMQRLLRQSLKAKPDYFTAGAHPVAFDPKDIDGAAFLKAAHALTPATLPPFVGLTVRQDSMPRQYIDFFDAIATEGIADTPLCVSRIVRGTGLTRRLTVEAASPNLPGATFRWFPVSGDPAKVRVKPLTPNGALATIEVDWQEAPRPAADGMPTRRVDIACVAVTPEGVASAPVFVSFRHLANERRQYDAAGRLLAVDYTVPKDGYRYEDPLISAFKNWRDVYLYDDANRLLGWTRTRLGQETPQRFDAHGRRVAEQNADGTPKRTVPVTYLPRVIQGGDGLHAPAIELIQSDAASSAP